MLDINLIRDNPKEVKKSLKKRLLDEKLVDNLLELDDEWRRLKKQVDQLRARRNKISQEINLAKKKKANFQSLIKEAKNIPKQLQTKEEKLAKCFLGK